MRKSKNNLIAALMLVGLVGGVMVGAYVVSTPGALKVSDDMRRPRNSKDLPQIAKKDQVQTLRPYMGADRRLAFDRKDVDVPAGVDARVFAVNEFLRQSKVAAPGTRCIGIDLQGDVAHLSFSREFLEGQGSDDEGILINGILATMSQFTGIEKVQFEVDGKPVDELGHLEIRGPQPVVRLED